MQSTMKMTCAVRAADRRLEVDIHDTIGGGLFGDGVTSKAVLEQISRAKAATEIHVRINSGGGDVFEGLAIYNTISAHAARKVVTIDGLAASMASVIAMAGDEIIMPANAMMMVHNPRSYVAGEANKLRRQADLLDKTRENLANIYAARTRQPIATVLAQMDAETWMTAREAQGFGYADQIIEARTMVAQWDGSVLASAPTEALGAVPLAHLKPRERARLMNEAPQVYRRLQAEQRAAAEGIRAEMGNVRSYAAWKELHTKLVDTLGGDAA